MRAIKLLLVLTIWLPVLLNSCKKDDQEVSQSKPANVLVTDVTESDQQVKITWLLNTDNEYLKTKILYNNTEIEAARGVNSVVVTKLTNDALYKISLIAINRSGIASDTTYVNLTPSLQIPSIQGYGLLPGTYNPIGKDAFKFIFALNSSNVNTYSIDTTGSTLTGTVSRRTNLNVDFIGTRTSGTNVLNSTYSFNVALTFNTDTGKYFSYGVLQKYQGYTDSIEGKYKSFVIKTEYDPANTSVYYITSTTRDVYFKHDGTYTYNQSIIKYAQNRSEGTTSVISQNETSTPGKWDQGDVRSGKYYFIKYGNGTYLMSPWENLYKKQ